MCCCCIVQCTCTWIKEKKFIALNEMQFNENVCKIKIFTGSSETCFIWKMTQLIGSNAIFTHHFPGSRKNKITSNYTNPICCLLDYLLPSRANIYGNEWRCFYWEIHLQRFSQHYLHSSRANALNGTTNHRVAHLSQVNFLFSATLPIIFAILTQTNCHLTTFININLCKAKSKKETNLSSPFLLCIFWNYVVSPVAITEFREWFLHKSDQYGKTSWKS